MLLRLRQRLRKHSERANREDAEVKGSLIALAIFVLYLLPAWQWRNKCVILLAGAAGRLPVA